MKKYIFAGKLSFQIMIRAYNIIRCKTVFAVVSALLLMHVCYASAQQAGKVINIKAGEESKYFYSAEIPDDVFNRMRGKSFPKNCTVKRGDLRYLRVLHINKEGRTQVGEMICNKSISADLIDIFRQLYAAKYPIERMVLIDEYGADDTKSMEANNTSCFNFRLMTGSSTRVSKHGMGLAVDINPLYNPYVKGNKVEPEAGKPYARNRTSSQKNHSPFIINHSSLPYRLFREKGFRWGGDWKSLKDYQHFEK